MPVANSIYISAQNLAHAAGFRPSTELGGVMVSSPGKFEGEPWHAPYYWNETMDGNGDVIWPETGDDEESQYCGSLLTVSGEESEAFDLPCGSWILVREDSQGFVYVTNHETRKLAEEKFAQWAGF